MENEEDEVKKTYDKNALMLTEEEINAYGCCKHLTSEQKAELISTVYEISLVLYNHYIRNDEST